MEKKAVLGAVVALILALFSISYAKAQNVLPEPDPPFKGKIGLTPTNSVKDFPRR